VKLLHSWKQNTSYAGETLKGHPCRQNCCKNSCQLQNNSNVSCSSQSTGWIMEVYRENFHFTGFPYRPTNH
ncbi:unnamed protein product, partial [Brassica oleracea var. botrytis]